MDLAMRELRRDSERRMNAYRFQQTMKYFSRAYLFMVSRRRNADRDQLLLNILLENFDVMLFVEPTLSRESYIYGHDHDLNREFQIMMSDLDELVKFFTMRPEVYDAFMNKIEICDAFSGDEPLDGIVAF